MSKTNFYETLLSVLRTDKRFLSESGMILRNAVYEAAMKMDENLIKLLLSNKDTCSRFFTDVAGVKVFDKALFAWIINNRQFLPNSYTRFKNKIGLTDGNGDLISSSENVELVFPYKDCVLEGGQTKEDQKRDEIFYNETLAPDEIDRLLYPKVLVNARRYSLENKAIKEECGIEYTNADNLVIKGNNLLSIASIKKRFEGEIKCVYIDVPYNTGNDSFGYNDRFNHSTWLCFMKNRLEIAHTLLKPEGTIAISVDNYEIGYLLVLLDEVFGKENRKNIITVKRGSVTGAKVINPGVVNLVEYVVIYSKKSTLWKPNRVLCAREYDSRYGNYILHFDEGYENWEFSTVLEEFAKETGVQKSKLKSYYGKEGFNEALEAFVLAHSERICQLATLDDDNISQQARELKNISLQNPDHVMYLDRGNEEKPYYVKGGKLILFLSDRLANIDGKMTFSQPISDIWDDVLPNDIHNEGGVVLKKGKKPEKLISRILELCTNEGDTVIDFFAGSGTTGAVAMKMNRKFILCEQMDYIKDITCQRLYNTIIGDTRGVSINYGWQGGGSFVYCELAKQNQAIVEEIEAATDKASLSIIYNKMIQSGFISHKVNPKEIASAAEDFSDLSLDDQKTFLMEILDKNLLYVNYCDIDDTEFAIPEEDKAFTRSFYGE
ncbi:site-specific DNA-methyltransferase [Fibrobacter sp. UWB5]|uniref:DNA methyltransferase n=1 Tax=Fibrobacter sp. UWB5 TaxID=1964360 RepID=UPI000B520854|nr:site-specific DNA-methyltransferase [Fibrobacter sp. UWB5]OWV14131.1 DNA methylase [Fibrobacter sp. UWB5]